jgi:predicted enzyme related to lactoylglutathione lyase
MSITASNVTIMIKDMDNSISFYNSIGFETKSRWGNHYAQLTTPGLTIGLHPANESNFNGSGNISIGFTTDDIDATKAMLDKLSISFQSREEEGGKFLHFTDPDDTQLYFIKPKW